MTSNHLILCHPLLLLPSIFPNIRVFSNESAPQIRWPSFGASASVLPMNIQGWYPLGLTALISLMSKGLSRVFSSKMIQKYPFFSTQPSLWSSCHTHTWLLGKPEFWAYRPLSAEWCLCFFFFFCTLCNRTLHIYFAEDTFCWLPLASLSKENHKQL